MQAVGGQKTGKTPVRSLGGRSALAMGLAMPAKAQQSMHRYLEFFKYADAAVKAMTENPQDRSAQAAKLAETSAARWKPSSFPAGSEYDGMVIFAFPDDETEEAQNPFVRATGNFTKTQSIRGIQSRIKRKIPSVIGTRLQVRISSWDHGCFCQRQH